MARRRNKINNLVIFAGLVLNAALFWVLLQLWPQGFKPLPLPSLSVPALVQTVRPPAVAQSTSLPDAVPAAPGLRIIDGPRKILKAAGADQEVVSIDGEKYVVGPPWLGHSLPQLIDPRDPGLVMLPRGMTFEERQIYVTAATREAFLKMAEAASQDGVRLQVDSGYRSAGYQRAIYRKRLAEGINFAEISRSVAPPGYSEHMLGCTLDLVPSDWSFKGTAADKWLRVNAGRFSFVQSYPAQNPQGFAWEPWHWKYVGTELSSASRGKVRSRGGKG